MSSSLHITYRTAEVILVSEVIVAVGETYCKILEKGSNIGKLFLFSYKDMFKLFYAVNICRI